MSKTRRGKYNKLGDNYAGNTATARQKAKERRIERHKNNYRGILNTIWMENNKCEQS